MTTRITAPLIMLILYTATAYARRDGSLAGSDTVINRGIRYVIQLDSTHTLRVVSNGDTTILVEDNSIADLKLEDFDADGDVDILVAYFENVPNVYDLFLFDPHRRVFRHVTYFDRFPTPIPIKGTGYYYSYHRSGCADMNWNSDLFRIENFTAIPVADIHGVECEGAEQGIFVTEIDADGTEIPVATFTLDVLDRPGYKWGFIEYYWTKVFLRTRRRHVHGHRRK